MEDFLKMMANPLAMVEAYQKLAERGVEAARAYQEMLEARAIMLRAMAAYTEAERRWLDLLSPPQQE